MQKTCFFSPYFAQMHTGGGEKHLLEIALAISKKRQVLIAITESQQATLLEYQNFYTQFLGRNLKNIEFVWTPLFTEAAFWRKLLWTQQFDELFYVTDGSLFFSLAKKNFLHIQIPFTNKMNGLLDRLKLHTWSKINTNSRFTKNIIEKVWRINIDQVLYPCVNLDEFQPKTKKQKIIIGVGRFFTHLHSKRQDILIQAFEDLLKKHPKEFKDWQLVLLGGVEDYHYFDKVKELAKNLPIKFIKTASRGEVVELFNQAKFFWHAAGFGIDEEIEPEKVEHLGIATLEAMAAGCIPIVVGKGGQREVLGDLTDQLSWGSIDECVNITYRLLLNDKKLQQLQTQLIVHARKFDQKTFIKSTKSLFEID